MALGCLHLTVRVLNLLLSQKYFSCGCFVVCTPRLAQIQAGPIAF